jgi:hypothetical protein
MLRSLGSLALLAVGILATAMWIGFMADNLGKVVIGTFY